MPDNQEEISQDITCIFCGKSNLSTSIDPFTMRTIRKCKDCGCFWTINRGTKETCEPPTFLRKTYLG